jgi:hypothetical protein
VGKKRLFSFGRKKPVPGWVRKLGKFLIQSQLLTIFLTLCILGVWIGLKSRPRATSLPYDQLFENLGVLSYRDSPSDTLAHFVVQLSAAGHVFREYDIDTHTFRDPMRGRDYRRSISGTHYPPLQIRGHMDRGFWLEMPDSTIRSFLPEQFNELYQTTLGYMKPVSVVTSVLGMLSGYSVGYRLATWSRSLANPSVQERILSSAHIGRMITREAWRRVLMEPVLMGNEGEASRFAALHGTQRLYINFFKLALNDSDGFIPREAVRLDTTGHSYPAHTMLAFRAAVLRAAADSVHLGSADFAAVENWASLLDRRGHWAAGAIPPPGEERMKYLGTLAWFGLEPTATDERRIWVGPRMLVREGDTEGFVADDLPALQAACPTAWKPWLDGEVTGGPQNAWTGQWLGSSREFAPVFEMARGIAGKLSPGK